MLCENNNLKLSNEYFVKNVTFNCEKYHENL